jgi:hypothetical protein
MSQLINCSYCSKAYEPYKTSKGNMSMICISCRETQQKAEARRPARIRNYQAEAKRNIEGSWKTFISKSVEKRDKQCTLTKEEYFELIQKNLLNLKKKKKDLIIKDRINIKQYRIINSKNE